MKDNLGGEDDVGEQEEGVGGGDKAQGAHNIV